MIQHKQSWRHGINLFSVLISALGVVLAASLLTPIRLDAQELPRQEDVTTLDGIMNAYYEVVSGPAGEERDWARDRSLHHEDAQVAIVRNREDGSAYVAIMTLAEFHGPPGPAQNAFYEYEIHREVRRHGANVHVWSTYEWTDSPDGEPRGRGVNSIQLFWDGSRWWITEWFFDGSRDAPPVPDAYLPENRWSDRGSE